MLLSHSEFSQPNFSAPIPFTEILEDYHQLLWGGCVVVGRQVIKPATELYASSVERIKPLSIRVAHCGSHKDLVRILLLVLYPSESSDIRRDVCLVCLVWFVKSQDHVVLWTDVRVRRVCPVAVARNSVHHGYEGDFRGGETVLSRLARRPSSAWVSAPP